MRLRLLGSFEFYDESGNLVEIRGAQRRTVFAALALDLNRVVPVEHLQSVLWEETPPPRARTAVQVHISAIRRLLDDSMQLATRHAGYALVGESSTVDVHHFSALVARAGATGDDEVAAGLLFEALELWRGSACPDIPSRRLRESALVALEDARSTALVSLTERLLRLRRSGELLPQLAAAVRTHPFHEPLVRAFVLALHDNGRQAQAINAYHHTRRLLADELGVDPSAELQDAYRTVLNGDLRRSPGGGRLATPAVMASPRVTPAQLPSPAWGFTGRAKELDWLALHHDAPVVMIVGPVGVGKTTLALHWAHRIVHDFPDGQLFVSLRGFDEAEPLNPSEALARMLRALGVPAGDMPDDLDGRSALYRSVLATKRMLVVLDGARTPGQVVPLLPGTPSSMAIVTSRNRLDSLLVQHGAVALRLTSLDRREALDLLGKIIGQARVEAEQDAAARLVELCDQLPIALRVAAVPLAGDGSQSIASMVGGLTDEHERWRLWPPAASTSAWRLRSL